MGPHGAPFSWEPQNFMTKGLQTTRVHSPPIRPRMNIWGISGLPNAMVACLHQCNVHIKRSYGYGEPRNVIAASVQKVYFEVRAFKLAGFMPRLYDREWKFGKIRGYILPWHRVYTNAMSISKGCYGCG